MSRAQSNLGIVTAQVSFLVSTLAEDSASRIESESAQLIQQHGPEVHVHLLRRLLVGAASALKQSPPSPAVGQSLSQPQLALRLLVKEVRTAARDPDVSTRLKDALLANINDMGNTQGIPEGGRSFPLAALLTRAELTDLERLIILTEIVRVLNVPQGRGRDPGLVALRLLRAALPKAIAALKAGPAQGGLPGLGPLQLGKMLSVGSLLGDWSVHPLTGEIGVGEQAGRERPISIEGQRELVRAIAVRLNSGETAASVVAHALGEVQCVQARGTS